MSDTIARESNRDEVRNFLRASPTTRIDTVLHVFLTFLFMTEWSRRSLLLRGGSEPLARVGHNRWNWVSASLEYTGNCSPGCSCSPWP